MTATPTLTRRGLLVAGGLGGALVVGWAVWPREYRTLPPTAENEHAFNAWLTIARDGRVTVAVPQVELGQGAYTAVAQMVADELGADWRTVGVAPALPSAAQANLLIARGRGRWLADERARREGATLTGGSSTVRALEWPARAAGAEARDRLRTAAAAEWGVELADTDARDGFVVAGNRRARFGELAEAAAALPSIVEPQLWYARTDPTGTPIPRLTGTSVPRLDAPSKVDGQATYAADVRLPDMVFARAAAGPGGTTRVGGLDRAAAQAVPDVLGVVESDGWVAVVARHTDAAERGLQTAAPRWQVADAANGAALDRALAGVEDWDWAGGAGDTEELWTRDDRPRAAFTMAARAHFMPEPLAAAADVTRTRAQVWAASQMPAALADELAERLGLPRGAVTVVPVLAGGSFGRRASHQAAVQAAVVSREMGRPVSLSWSRAEDVRQDRVGPPARVLMAAAEGPGGALSAWGARVARAGDEETSPVALLADDPLAGLPYPVADWSVERAQVPTSLPTGPWRGGAAVPLAFAAEAFADELAARAGVDPFSWRIEKLGGDPRLAACLTEVAEIGGWTGGAPGSGQGLAIGRLMGARVAVLAAAHLEGSRPVVDRLACAVDCGRVVHPDMVRQQVEGQLLFAATAALASRPTYRHGFIGPASFAQGRMATPEVAVALMPRREEPGGVGSVVTPYVAPAIANALASATGRRWRDHPFGPDPAQ